MDSRAQFEEWFACNYFDQYCTNIFALDEDREYLHGQVSLALKARQASRAAIEIDLSDTFSPNDCGDDAVWVDVLLRELNKHGIKGESS